MNIKYSNKANDILGVLADALTSKYFSFEYQSVDYVDRLKDEVDNSVSILGTSLPKAGKKYQTPKYGRPTHFIRYKVNARTTWYILVRIGDNKALVTYIHNNNEKIHSIAKAKR